MWRDNLNSKDIAGKKVIGSRGTRIGEVESIDVDPRTWRIDSLVVDVDRDVTKDLGMEQPLLGGPRITIETDLVKDLADVIVLNMDLDGLKRMLGKGRNNVEE